MIGRSGLVAFARGEASEADVGAIRDAILAADRAATDNIEGTGDEHHVFVKALIASLDLLRSANRQPLEFPTGPLALALVVKPKGMSDYAISKGYAKIVDVSPNTVRARMERISATSRRGRRF